jgi:hypothetical protein
MLSPAESLQDAPPRFDPGWLIHRTLDTPRAETPEDAAPSAEDAVLAWLVRLPEAMDPATAAGDLLRAYRPGIVTDPLAARVFALLEEIETYPRARLNRMPRGRGGRARRYAARPS